MSLSQHLDLTASDGDFDDVDAFEAPAYEPAPAASHAPAAASHAPAAAQASVDGREGERALVAASIATWPCTMMIDSDRIVNRDIQEKLKCSVCLNVVQNPVMFDVCGHTVCHGWCLRNCELRTKTIGSVTGPAHKCPECRLFSMQKNVVPNMFIQRMVTAAEVKCANAESGCTKIYIMGTNYREELTHMVMCDYSESACENCPAMVQRRNMIEHTTVSCLNRRAPCVLCTTMVDHHEANSHRNTGDERLLCLGFVYCPNECIMLESNKRSLDEDIENKCTVILQSQLDSHEKTCARAMIECVVCHEVFQRRYEHRHMKSNYAVHNSIFMNRDAPDAQPAVAPGTSVSGLFLDASYRRVEAGLMMVDTVALAGKIPLRSERLNITLSVTGATQRQILNGFGRLAVDLVFDRVGVRPSPLLANYALRISILRASQVGDFASDVMLGFNIRSEPLSSSVHVFSTSWDADKRRFDTISIERLRVVDAESVTVNNNYGFYFELYKKPVPLSQVLDVPVPPVQRMRPAPPGQAFAEAPDSPGIERRRSRDSAVASLAEEGAFARNGLFHVSSYAAQVGSDHDD
jgi:hypothetical protein